MCNKLHADSKPISFKGTGYKLFSEHDRALCGEHSYMVIEDETRHLRKMKPGDWVVPIDVGDSFGFCFFLTIKEAIRAGWGWADTDLRQPVIHEIEYQGGMGYHQEDQFVDGEIYEIALCKTFRITK